jgi:hypothetical protein
LHYGWNKSCEKKQPPLFKVLSIIVYIVAFIWLVGVVPTVYYTFTHRALPSLTGMRLLGGPFEILGLDALIVAGIGYVMVSALKILAVYWLWGGRADGTVLEMILLGLSTIFWYGFALPIRPLLGVIQVVLLALTWRTLD